MIYTDEQQKGECIMAIANGLTATGESWADWADSFAVRLMERAQEAERQRTVLPESFAEAEKAGFFGMIAPVGAGGQGLGFGTFVDVVRRMAQGCPSSAWSLSFLSLHAWMLAKFGAEAQAEFYKDGKMPLCPAPLAPTGFAEKVEGGYRVNGRWEWATGVNHSDWVLVNALEKDTMMPRFCAFRIGDVEVEDVWHVSGMAATGSHAVRVTDKIVPEYLTLPAMQMAAGASPGDALHPDSTLTFPLRAGLALVAATPALGAAEGALKAFLERMRAKTQAFSGGAKQADMPSTHLRIGEAMATVRAARLVWDDAIRSLEAEGPNGATADVEALVGLRIAAANVVRLSTQAVDIMATAAGASAYFLFSPIQRHLRDLQMMRGHVMFDWDRTAILVGKVAMGHPTTPADLI